MKERPILFNREAVQAILEGRKTQMRRVVKGFSNIERYHHQGEWRISFMCKELVGWACPEAEFVNKCPYGVPGDRLWCRESWSDNGGATCYRADYSDEIARGIKWRPPLSMRREHCRLTLEVIGVRVERLQSISEEDAKAEGVSPYHCPQAEALMNAVGGGMKPIPFTSGFANAWTSIHGPTAWAANPWVWVVEFRQVGGAP